MPSAQELGLACIWALAYLPDGEAALVHGGCHAEVIAAVRRFPDNPKLVVC
jgi:hypothetical protein